jgi:hypothetical protein
MSKKQLCVFTVSKNENVFLPAWTKHYSKYLEQNDIYVFDHLSTDNSISKMLDFTPKVSVECVDFDVSRFENYTNLVKAKQSSFLRQYEYVLFAETDEFIFPKKERHSGFDSYLKTYENKTKNGQLRCQGIEIVHDYKSEHDKLDFDEVGTWTKHRNHCRAWYKPFSPSKALYSKPLLSNVELNWRNGFHDINDSKGIPIPNIYIDNELLFVHCHDIDIYECERRHQAKVNNFSNTLLIGAQVSVGSVLKEEFDVKLSKCVLIPPEYKEQF